MPDAPMGAGVGLKNGLAQFQTMIKVGDFGLPNNVGMTMLIKAGISQKFLPFGMVWMDHSERRPSLLYTSSSSWNFIILR
jgi:hypothetical protein